MGNLKGDDVVSQDLLQTSESERDCLARQCEDEKRSRAELEIRMTALAETAGR